MYCDDPCVLCVGPDMAHEALKVWTWMSKSGNTMMAIPEKRSFGLSAKWIGIKFFTGLGIIAVTSQKVLRACAQITEASNDSLTRDQYRSFIGFLEHVRDTLFLRGDKMYGLYEPLSRGLEPIERVVCNNLMLKQLARFKAHLMVQSGSSVSQLIDFLSGRPLPKVNYSLAARRYALFSDAAKEGTDRPGLGGWICGYTWVVPLTPEDLELDIPVLEAIAAVVNVVAAHKIVGGTDHLPEDVCFEAHVDAQATAHVLIRGKARSPMMQLVHAMALQSEAFREMLPFLVVMHCYGLGNVASDAVSRGYDKVVSVVAAALGVRVMKVEPPRLAFELLSACKELRGRMLHEHRWGHAGERIGDASRPGPAFEPMASRKRQRVMQQSSPLNCSSVGSFEPVRGAKVVVESRVGNSVSSTLLVPPQQRLLQRVNTHRLGSMDAETLAGMLWSDSSDFSICSGNWMQLKECCDVALSSAGDAFSQRTAQADRSHYASWSRYCKTMNTCPVRPVVDPVSDRRSYLREIVLLINALTYFMKTHKPRSSVIKPQSAMNILLGANRVLRQNFSAFIPLGALKLPLKGIMRQFLQRFGPKSLVPKRREPFTNGMIRTLVSLPANLNLGAIGQLSDSAMLQLSWNAAVSVAASAGFRKSEMFQSNETTFYLTWDMVACVVAGTPTSMPSDAQLKALCEGDFIALTPPPSKSDQFNQVWGAHPLYLPYHNTPRNAARNLALLGVKQGLQHRQQPRSAVFTDSGRKPLKAAHMAAAMYRAMTAIVGPERAKLFTWHSARISLATMLYQCKVKPATIQAMLRWQTEESLRTYCRLGMADYGSMLDRAAEATVAAVQTSNIPVYEQFQFFTALNSMVEDL